MLRHEPRNLVRPGVIGTVAYLSAGVFYALVEWQALLSMTPNEFADFLAGCFAPLAFLWLVLGFFQQGDELRNSVAALKLQGEELRNSVEQQRQLVEVTREQLGLDHAKQRSEAEAAVRQAEPIFHISAHVASSRPVRNGDAILPRRYYSKFRVLNVGPECRNLKFSDGGNVNEYYPSFGKEKPVDFVYEIIQDNEIEPRTLTISCTDMLGNDLQFEMILEPRDGQYGPEYHISREDGHFAKITAG